MITLPAEVGHPLDIAPPGREPYQVYVESEWTALAAARVAALARGRVFLISQKGLEPQADFTRIHLAEKLGERLSPKVVFLEAGEQNKSLSNLAPVYDTLIEAGADRRSLLVAVGGGTVGDFVGFLAATLYRGIDFVQFPTTLLAAVDASVGGKTGVNVSRGKNLIGAFHQPRMVYFHLPFLATLPEAEWACGLAEMFKHALLEGSGRLLSDLERSAAHMRRVDSPTFRRAIIDSVAVKARVVEQDEREAGIRAALNLGHTTAHAIESLTQYRRFSHGEAVARGLVTMLLLSRTHLGLEADFVERMLVLMEALSLPRDTAGLAAADVGAHLKYDKKSVDGAARFVLLQKGGGVRLDCPISVAQFEAAWQEQGQRFGAAPQAD